MTLDETVALSLVQGLSRVGLGERLRTGDPTLREVARPFIERARSERRKAEARGVSVVPWNDPRFPRALRHLPDMPPALWYRGALAALDAPAVALVGSRAASAGALQTAARLGTDLAARGITVVSGLARGVDSAAHRGALATGRTAAVLGSGIDRIYPAEHAGLAGEIARDGVVMSEYPPGTPPLAFHFPLRNRLISGVSCVVVVVEANEKSGSLITAASALDQGKEVMAVPGSVLGGRNRGAHALIRDGAKIVETADDIVGELCWTRPLDVPGSRDVSVCTETTSQTSVLAVMPVDEACDIDGLSARTGLDVSRLLRLLLDLELTGQVRRDAVGRFMRRI